MSTSFRGLPKGVKKANPRQPFVYDYAVCSTFGFAPSHNFHFVVHIFWARKDANGKWATGQHAAPWTGDRPYRAPSIRASYDKAAVSGAGQGRQDVSRHRRWISL